MAEERNVWADLLARQQHDITRAFMELQGRWRGIFDQEGARWHQVGQEWKVATGEDGRLRYDAYPKTLEATVEDFQKARGEMREATETRLPWEAYAGQGSSMSGPSPERQTPDWMPERGTVAYVEWVVREAICTGVEEGHPLRANEIAQIWQDVWAQEIGQGPHVPYWTQGHDMRAEQDAYEARPYDLLEERAHGEPSYADTRVGLQETLWEVQERLQDYHPQSAEAMDLRADAAEIRDRLERLGGEADYPTQYTGMMGSAPERLEIETSAADLGEGWQAQLAALEARLDALAQQGEAHEETHQQAQGMER